MYKIYFSTKEGRWFSTATVWEYYRAEKYIAQEIQKEIQAHVKRWPDCTWAVYRNNRNVTDWYMAVITA